MQIYSDMLPHIMLGHLVGDYIFQNDWMALNKSKKTIFGSFTCLVHCLFYSICVCLFTVMDPLWFCLVFISHYPIDRYSLAENLAKAKGNGKLIDWMTSSSKGQGWARTEQVTSAFKAFVYIMNDNTLHLMIMWGFWNFFILK